MRHLPMWGLRNSIPISCACLCWPGLGCRSYGDYDSLLCREPYIYCCFY
ncbi:hypothetical protein Pint_27621 [Pistacia integerrima]|uniref:Uncharacterized protein n=1 Tax=Pistacia integerrima TaxID=434235 RepID=A0ACC0YQX2_9ROSI|nr:hypothetical protein Pint_27621 [Pistacia integerrima]